MNSFFLESANSALLFNHEYFCSHLFSSFLYACPGRTDGAICSYTEEDRKTYLQELKEEGVTNIDMEATVIGAMCNAVGECGGGVE